MGDDGTVQQLASPQLLLPGTQQPLQLVLDSHSVDVVGLLLQAVQVIVANQLQFLHGEVLRLLNRDKGRVGGGDSSSGAEQGCSLQLRLCRQGHLSSRAQQRWRGQAAALPSPASPAAAEGLHGLAGDAEQQEQQQRLLLQLPDALEVLVEGQPALTVSFQPWSGRLVLRLGSAYGGDSNIEMGATLHQVRGRNTHATWGLSAAPNTRGLASCPSRRAHPCSAVACPVQLLPLQWACHSGWGTCQHSNSFVWWH